MSDLKPCPFCWGKAELDRTYYDEAITFAQCPNCQAGIPAMAPSREEADRLAIAAWNRRAGEEENV